MTADLHRVRLLWPDHLGLARGKYLTPEENSIRAGWQEALDGLEADTDLVEAYSPAFVDGFVTVKRAEWDRYQKWITGWEIDEYLPFF